MSDSDAAEISAITRAADGLTYPSESDEPFDVFCWHADGAASAGSALAHHIDNRRKLECVAPESFFAQLDQADDAARYRQLQKTLESCLSGLQVFRVGAGEVRVDVYLVGRTRAGNWAGLHTVSVET